MSYRITDAEIRIAEEKAIITEMTLQKENVEDEKLITLVLEIDNVFSSIILTTDSQGNRTIPDFKGCAKSSKSRAENTGAFDDIVSAEDAGLYEIYRYLLSLTKIQPSIFQQLQNQTGIQSQ